MTRIARHPAAWINTVYEGKNFDEAIGYLQQLWDDYVDMENRNYEALGLLRDALIDMSCDWPCTLSTPCSRCATLQKVERALRKGKGFGRREVE